jgi:hypothetical protein
MKTTNRTKNRLLIVLAVSLSTSLNSARAGSVSHYNPGIFNIRDYFVPEPGLYGGIYNYYYTSGQFNDANGNAISSVNIRPGPGPGVTLDVKPSLDLYAFSPVVIWTTPWNLCGIKYAAYIAPSFANSSIEAEVTTLRGRGVNASNSSFGVGDLFVQPIWLGYTLTNWDFSLGYGFYAPIGRYNTVTVNLPVVGPVTTGSPDNIGLGFWTHQFQGAGAWYPWADKRMAVMAALTYELNTQKRDLDVTPGEHLTLNWGISQYLPLMKDKSLLLEVGPAGYDDWQISDDSGGIAPSDNSRARVHAAGGQLGLTYVPWNAALNFHAFYEYSATARLQGTAYGLSLVVKF